ncbi:matrix protein [Fikirini virus]|uniref:Matrix protein n=1 Tax=Fikirini virus TaxID=1408144 RepID=U5NF19_9RHAB|nr:matrix protein [Fikirini virus]AGY14295.1 matrix protein [Fikirini virus]
MLRLLKRPSRVAREEEKKDPSAPPPSQFCYPSIDDIGPEIFSHTLRVQSSIEIRTKSPISSFDDCLKILEVWIDEAQCPIWQHVIDSWMFYCMGVHAQKDPRCTFAFFYRAQIDQVLTFSHSVKEFDPLTVKAVRVSYETAYKGQLCEVSFYNNMTKSKRSGAPFNVLYYAPLKDGNPPKPMSEWRINLPFELKETEQGLTYLSPKSG